jgi:hypothetical protein
MKMPTAWFELSALVTVLTVVGLGVMWTERPLATCGMTFEGPRALILTRAIDREHLATDLGAATRGAERFMRLDPDPSDQRARFVECYATLVQQIATTHHLSPEQARSVAADTP